jgi:hypothetical protein
VFNQATGDVEGILVRGDTDFVFNGECRISNVCSTNGCRGEDVTRVSQFAENVPHIDSMVELGLDVRVSNVENALNQISSDLNEIKNRLQE